MHEEVVPWTARLVSALGLLTLIGIAYALSENRKAVPWRLVGVGTSMQLLFALIVLKTHAGQAFFSLLNDGFARLLAFTAVGTKFLVGDYLDDSKFSVALSILPTIIFFSSLMAVLYHLRIVQPIVKGLAWVMQRSLKTSGAETLSTVANIFVGQTEAPLVVRPYVATMTRSELMAVMVGGFATIAGGVLAAYVGMLRDAFPDIAGHLIAASVMSAPATLVVAKLMVPETETPVTSGTAALTQEQPDANVIDAAARGAGEGLTLALNVGAMLLAFVALIAMVNALVGVLWHGLTLEAIFGWLLWPIAFLLGIPAHDCSAAATLLGEKTVLNEFVAYAHLAEKIAPGGSGLSRRTVLILSYALCGFANFSSIAIQIGGLGGMAPTRRSDIARLGLRAMLAGTIASFMTAAIAGMIG